MPSTDATLLSTTEAGNFPSARRQTLLKLLKLYNLGNTDPDSWIEVIESDPATLSAALAISTPANLEDWPDSWLNEDYSRFTLTLCNHLPNPATTASDNQLVFTTEAICHLIDPAVKHRAGLIARLAGSGFISQASEVAEALQYYQRPPTELFGTGLMTRILGAANHLQQPDPDLQTCASLLRVNELDLKKQIATTPSSVPDELQDLETYRNAVSSANLSLSLRHAAATISQHQLLVQLSQMTFGSSAIELFLQKDGGGWVSDRFEITDPFSIVGTAAEKGMYLNSTAVPLTVLDERILGSLNCKEVLAIPILMDQRIESCAAVVAVGLETSVSDNQVIQFQQLARVILDSPPDPSVKLQDVQQYARELIHEANNPLSTVQNYLKILSLKLGAEHEAQETIETIVNELIRTANIIQKFRDLQPQAGDSGTTHINEVVQQMTALYASSAAQFQFKTQLDMSDPIALISPDEVKQVITNLLKNATEALNPDNRICVRTAGGMNLGAQTFIEITVEDDGPGFQIDNPFEQGISTKSGENSGFGLYIVKQIIENSGGYVSYRSSSKGTEIRIAVPQTQQQDSNQ